MARKKRLAPPPPPSEEVKSSIHLLLPDVVMPRPSLKSRPAPSPPTTPFYLFDQSSEEEEDEEQQEISTVSTRVLSLPSSGNSSPHNGRFSGDSGVNSDLDLNHVWRSSRGSSRSNRSSLVSQDSLDLEKSYLVPAPPPPTLEPMSLSLHSLHQVDESSRPRTHRDLILEARGTLKKCAKREETIIPSSENSSQLEFYVNEGSSDTTSSSSADDIVSLASEEDFAGVKSISSKKKEDDGSGTIRSHRGTIRGVKNRVRAGIATFLQDPTVKNYVDREQRRVVVYVTTLGILRSTWARCVKVRQILRNLLIRVDERDVFMARETQVELLDRMGTDSVTLPQVFVEGQYFGDADTIEKLNESGELRHLLRPYKSLSVTSVCGKCGGFRMLPCKICNGSKKSVHRNDFTEQFVALRCSQCDDCGLIKCDDC